MSKPIISLRGINKNYGKFQALKDVDLDIYQGDIFGLIGRNGAGKTTLFKVILGLSEYQRGTVEIFGNNLSLGRKKIGFLIGSNFMPYMTGKQNLEYYRILKGIKNKKEVDRVLEIVGLKGVKSNYKNYSLGMRQRLGIANALLGMPEILVLDEPTNGLDPQGIADVRELLQKLNAEYGITIIVSSHILGELQHTANRFGIVNERTLMRTITQEDLITEQKAVRIQVDDLEKAKEILQTAGIKILDEVVESKSLEEFYFGMLGGGNENV